MSRKFVSSEENVARLLADWQASGEPAAFARLWSAAATFVYQVANHAIAKAGSRDKTATDDAASLVMEHLRRLPEGTVARYDQARSATQYLRWLATRRAQDAIRSRRRRHRLEQPQSPMLDAGVGQGDGIDPEEVAARDSLAMALAMALRKLDSRSQQVLRRHLAGERQASIAKSLGVCEGTITRIRQRAIEQLRRQLSDGDGPDTPRQPKPR